VQWVDIIIVLPVVLSIGGIGGVVPSFGHLMYER
jgi:hypothetical protein